MSFSNIYIGFAEYLSIAIQTTKQFRCKWLPQTKIINQALRHSSFKSNDTIRDVIEGSDECKNEASFKFSDLKIELSDRSKVRVNEKDLKFGETFTSHMLKIYYYKQCGGWQKPEIVPIENLSLHPATKVFHYAIEVFEGLKAYRGVDGKIRIFRPELNMARMNYSAESAVLPTFDGNELLKCIKKLISIDQDWVPCSESTSLYVRPTLIGIDEMLGVSESDNALLFTILSPTGDYFPDTYSISLLADPNHTRSWPGGCGDKKLGANYAPTLRVRNLANKRGREEALWLFGEDHQVTEVGLMNIFMFYINDNGEKALATPPLNGLILPGITRQSIIEMAQEWNDFKVEQRIITMKEIIHLQKCGQLLELFGCGTAAGVVPISTVEYSGDVIPVPTMEQSDPIYMRLRVCMQKIRYGHVEHPWAQVIE